MGKDEEDNSIGNWEGYRIEILNKRKTPRTINDIINILKTIWELLNNALNNQNITNIHCFMNIIFNPLNVLINNSKEMKTPEDRREFEKEFDTIVKNYITDYTILSEKYLKVSDSFKIIDKDPVLGFPSNIDNEYPYLYDLFSVNVCLYINHIL